MQAFGNGTFAARLACIAPYCDQRSLSNAALVIVCMDSQASHNMCTHVQEQLRDAPLRKLQLPMLFIRGSRDPFCDVSKFEATLPSIPSKAVQVGLQLHVECSMAAYRNVSHICLAHSHAELLLACTANSYQQSTVCKYQKACLPELIACGIQPHQYVCAFSSCKACISSENSELAHTRRDSQQQVCICYGPSRQAFLSKHLWRSWHGRGCRRCTILCCRSMW